MRIQTELGRKSLGELCCFSKDRVSATFANAYNYVSVDNLLPDKKGKTLASSTPDRGYLFQYQIGDILLGNIRPYLKKIWFADITGTTNGDVLVVRTRRENSISPRFVYYVLSSDDFFAYSMQNAKGTKMPRGDKEAIMNYEFLVPPLEEQERIASALSSVDELIASLDKQIAKTRDIKQATVHQLLSNENPSYRTLGETCDITTGKLNVNAKDDGGKYPFFTCDLEPYRINTYAFDTTAILVAGNGYVGHVNYYSGKFNAYQRTYVLSDFKEWIHDKYMVHYMKAYLRPYLTKDTRKASVPFITLPTLESFPVPVPPLAEQERIAGVLTSFDDTIEGLEAKRQKYEFVKAGMMQQLLSGATCYVNS